MIAPLLRFEANFNLLLFSDNKNYKEQWKTKIITLIWAVELAQKFQRKFYQIFREQKLF